MNGNVLSDDDSIRLFWNWPPVMRDTSDADVMQDVWTMSHSSSELAKSGTEIKFWIFLYWFMSFTITCLPETF